MRRILAPLALAAAFPALALAPAAFAQDKGQDAPIASPDHPGYLADSKGCRVWDASPAANEQVLWTGKCEAGFATGQGTLVWRVDGNVAETTRGMFRRGKLDGPGVVILADGSSYAGDWQAGVQSGKGDEIKADGDTYSGDWAGGMYQGRGTYTFANGDRYEGAWADGLRRGQGTYTFASGDRYEGSFRADLPDGPGVLTRQGGVVLQGDWHAGCLVQGANVFAMNGDEAACRAAASSSGAAPASAPEPSPSGKPAPRGVTSPAPAKSGGAGPTKAPQ